MIVFENGAWQSNSLYPDTNYLEGSEVSEVNQPKWVVPDGSELSDRIKHTPHWEPVENENGNLTDIIPVFVPDPQPTDEEKAEEIREELANLENTDNTEKSELS